MPPTPAHTGRAGDGDDWSIYDGVKLPSLADADIIARLRSHGVFEEADKMFDYLDTIAHLADLLANFLAEPARVALREVVAEQLDVAAWLAANRPEVDG